MMNKNITRRELFGGIGALTIATGLRSLPGAQAEARPDRVAGPLNTPPPPPQLAGTEPLTMEGDFAAQMVEGIHRFLMKQTTASVETRQALWHRDYSSRKAYESSVTPNRERFGKIIGLMDRRIPYAAPSLEVTLGGPSVVASVDGYKVYSVRWPVFDNVDAEGLLLEPTVTPVARVVALPDADWSPEMLAGLATGVPPEAQFARRLAENGCLVLVPTLINRKDTWSGNKALGILTNLTHREYIYRMSYEIGRHIIGYEVQKILAAVDWFSQDRPSLPIGVIGYGEGGLLALYSAAADTRIDAVCASGYFKSRQDLWEEPLYRNVWTLLHEFGDAELAGLIAPRTLVVEASQGPDVPGPPSAVGGRRDIAASGRLVSPALSEVRAEVERAQPFFQKLEAADRLSLVVSGTGQGQPGSERALRAFLGGLGGRSTLKRSGSAPRDMRTGFDPSVRLHRQLEQLIDFSQYSVIESESVRKKFWAKADDSSVERWQKSAEPYRRYLWVEIFGKLPEPSVPLTAQTRKIYDEVNWTGYEVFLPLWPEVFAYGILLLPKGMEPDERRPVVVCQHGLEGRPRDVILSDDRLAEHYYHNFAADLANHGFVVYCPQNPYIGGDKFRKLQRLANPLKLSLYSFILSQHERTLNWLAAQPFVDAKRIGFYGLSYGGRTAVRVPPLLDKYALSISSGDFNEWIWKACRDDAPFTFCFAPDYEIYEFNLGNTFNCSQMANLMTPRPFMVERGHDDGVSVDSWVAYEYAKVQRHYDQLGLHDNAQIEY
ncbi:MAG: dienelactone hydrolase family protein, partial [Acidobacteriota bacterium]|nr:dienelactone hydrolase family protein [Acidobacteriota bacterium]